MKCFSRENIINLIVSLFPNKRVLDKFSQNENGVLLFDGKAITSSISNSSSSTNINFTEYNTTTNNYYSSKTISKTENVTTKTTFNFTDNIVEVEE